MKHTGRTSIEEIELTRIFASYFALVGKTADIDPILVDAFKIFCSE